MSFRFIQTASHVGQMWGGSRSAKGHNRHHGRKLYSPITQVLSCCVTCWLEVAWWTSSGRGPCKSSAHCGVQTSAYHMRRYESARQLSCILGRLMFAKHNVITAVEASRLPPHRHQHGHNQVAASHKLADCWGYVEMVF